MSGQLSALAVYRAYNHKGPVPDRLRKRLLAVIEDPCEGTWDDAHGIIIAMHGRTGLRPLTLWQAVMLVDPSFPSVGPQYDEADRKITFWERIPDQQLLLAALHYATRKNVRPA